MRRANVVSLVAALAMVLTGFDATEASRSDVVGRSGAVGRGLPVLDARGDRCWTKVRLPARARQGRLTDIVRIGRSRWLFGIAPPVRSARPPALRRGSRGWSVTRVPLVGASGLLGGDGRRRGSVWAVGFRRPGVSMIPVALRYAGGRWVSTRVPDPPGPGASLADVEVLRSGRALAVGARLQGGRTRPFALIHRGRWRRIDPPLDGREGGLTAIASDAAGRAWAVGWRLGRAGTEALILRRTASGWTGFDVNGLVDGQAVLTDIDFGSDGVGYAAGYELPLDGVRSLPLLLRWEGGRWTRVRLPWEGAMSALLHGVAVGPRGSLLLTGARLALNGGRNRGIHARFQDGEWALRLAPLNRFHNSELTDGEFIGGRPFAVGATATRSVYLRGCREVAAATAMDPLPRPDRRSARRAPRVTALVRPARRARSVRFRDVARRAGIHEVAETWGATVADFDGDGWDDVFLGRHNRLKPKLLMGGRRGFTRIGRGAFRLRDRHGCAAGDVDADGRPDLYCTVGANRGTNMTSNELWLRPGTMRRDQRTADYGVIDPFGRGRVATFLHLDDDPYPELFVANEPQRADGLPSLSRLYRNDGGRRFLSTPSQGLDHSMGGTCAVAGDIDSDGDDDLLVCADEPWGGLPAGVRAFRNVDGRLRHATKALGLYPIGDVDLVVADLDGDGRQDDVARLGRGWLRVSLGSRAGQRLVARRRVSAGVGLAAGDVNADGRADLYVLRGGSGNAPDLLLLNQRRGRRWVSQPIPQTRVGVADDVVALDHDRNGLDDFLVTNGRQSRGPIQLIAAFRR